MEEVLLFAFLFLELLNHCCHWPCWMGHSGNHGQKPELHSPLISDTDIWFCLVKHTYKEYKGLYSSINPSPLLRHCYNNNKSPDKILTYPYSSDILNIQEEKQDIRNYPKAACDSENRGFVLQVYS